MIKRSFFFFLRFVGATKAISWLHRKQVMILCYHCITPRPDLLASDPWKMYLDAESFETQLDYLQKNYNVISLENYLEARRENRPLRPFSVVLTFDDGKRNFLTAVLPRLVSRNLPATSFVVVKNTKKEYRENISDDFHEWAPEDNSADLSWENIDYLLKQKKVEIGSHTYTHPVLPQISYEEVENELKTSYEEIVKNTELKNVSLAYPFGQTSETVIEIARKTGYACGLTNTDAGNNPKTNLFRLNRTIINSDDDLNVFAARLAGVTWRLDQIKSYLRPVLNKDGVPRKENLRMNRGFIKNVLYWLIISLFSNFVLIY